jgi:hypothetical protein
MCPAVPMMILFIPLDSVKEGRQKLTPDEKTYPG